MRLIFYTFLNANHSTLTKETCLVVFSVLIITAGPVLPRALRSEEAQCRSGSNGMSVGGASVCRHRRRAE